MSIERVSAHIIIIQVEESIQPDVRVEDLGADCDLVGVVRVLAQSQSHLEQFRVRARHVPENLHLVLGLVERGKGRVLLQR